MHLLAHPGPLEVPKQVLNGLKVLQDPLILPMGFPEPQHHRLVDIKKPDDGDKHHGIHEVHKVVHGPAGVVAWQKSKLADFPANGLLKMEQAATYLVIEIQI
jgi:hypothetical protein